MSSEQGGKAKRPKVEEEEYAEDDLAKLHQKKEREKALKEIRANASLKGRTNHVLPHQLVLNQILTRLPSKSLIRCSCVCKLWSTLILHDTHFAASHFLKYSQKNPRLLYKFGGQGEINSFYLSSGGKESESDGKFVDLDKIETIGSEHKRELIGSCNGLVCLFNLDAQIIEICNPARHQILPISPLHPITQIDRVGFGYDSLSEEYKVVIINLELFECMVFALGTKESYWREIAIDKDVRNILCDGDRFKSATFCNGALYWGQGMELVSFYLNKEKFEVIQFPIKRFYGFSSRLLVHKGSLCCVNLLATCRAVVRWTVELYVLKDEGSEQVWEKKTFLHPYYWPGDSIQLVDFLDQLLLHRIDVQGEIEIYNFHTRKGKAVRNPDNLSNMDYWVLSSHVENLLSLQTFAVSGMRMLIMV